MKRNTTLWCTSIPPAGTRTPSAAPALAPRYVAVCRGAWLSALLLAACSSSTTNTSVDGGDVGDGGAPDGQVGESGGSMSSTGGQAGGGSQPPNGEGDGGTPPPDDEPPAKPMGCSKIDIVFAVDGSQSMTDELEAMRTTVFPAFADRVSMLASGEDFRVGTLDACPLPANLHTRGQAAECGFESGEIWIDGASSKFDDEVACVGNLYQADRACTGWNDDEQPISAIAAALEQSTPGGANEGFLRDGSLVVAIAITDEDEQPTTLFATPASVEQRVVDAVGGDPRRVVVLGIGGDAKCTGTYGDAEEAVFMKQVIDRFRGFQRGIFWDLCQGKLEDGLDTAFEIIEKACQELPPGEDPPGEDPPGEDPPGEDPPGEDPCEPTLDDDCGNEPPGPPDYPPLG